MIWLLEVLYLIYNQSFLLILLIRKISFSTKGLYNFIKLFII